MFQKLSAQLRGQYVSSLFLTEAASSCRDQIEPQRKSIKIKHSVWTSYIKTKQTKKKPFHYVAYFPMLKAKKPCVMKVCVGQNKTALQAKCNTFMPDGIKAFCSARWRS